MVPDPIDERRGCGARVLAAWPLAALVTVGALPLAGARAAEPTGTECVGSASGLPGALCRGDPVAIVQEADRVLLRTGGVEAWAAQVGALQARAEASLALADPSGAIAALRRAREALARVRPRLPIEDYAPVARAVHERLADLLLRASDGGGAASGATVREAIDVLEDLKVADLHAYFGDPCLENLQETTPTSVPQATLLYPIVLPDRVEVVVGRDGALERHRAPIAPDELRRRARSLRLALQDPTTLRYRRHAGALYDALVRPWARETWDATSALVVVAGPPLREIPFAALYDAPAKSFLIERVPVAILPTLRILTPEAFEAGSARVLAGGLSQATPGFAALPFVDEEVATLATQFPTTLRIGADFTAEALEAALDERAYDAIHLATHGQFRADASESFLVTADGRLGMQQLAEIVARTRHRTARPVELLALSACETAIGDDQALLGMAGVAVQAGARSAIATLWQVNDASTARLFEAFYRRLAEPGTPRGVALQHAQLALLGDRATRHPAFWSPFVLINSWR